jgi:hypothetical protein
MKVNINYPAGICMIQDGKKVWATGKEGFDE